MKLRYLVVVLGALFIGIGNAAETVAPPSAAPVNAASEPPAPASGEKATEPAVRTLAADRLDLDTTVVTGNRELPRVLYIVPWKKAELGDLPEQPFNTLLDEALTPVDRDEFRREVAYYSKLTDKPPTPAVSPGVATEARPAAR